ncbi:homeodomain-like protein [Tanacetum coccineum]
MKEINNFQQEHDETLFQAWERFKEPLIQCPQHNLTEMQEVILFYNGLEVPTRQILDSRGAIPTKTATDAKVAIQEMAEYSQKWYNGTSKTRSTETSDGLVAIQAQLNNLGKEIKKVNEKVYAAQVGSSHIDNSIPRKEKDPGSFTLPCFINNVCFDNALVDLGASVSVMSLSTYLNLGLGELAHTKLIVELADRTMKYPKGIAENVLVDGTANRVNLDESGATCDGNPKVISSLLVSPTAILIMPPRGPYDIDVAATFGVPLTTADRNVILNESDSMPKGVPSVKAPNNPNADDNMPGMVSPGDPILQSVDINTMSTSYDEAAGAIVKKVSTCFEHILYGYFIGKRMAFLIVEYYARNNWAKHGLKRIMMNNKGFFFFKFDSRAGLEAVLEGGPWLILFEEDSISLIATFIGKLVVLDSYTSSMCNDSWGWNSFARCLIEVVTLPIVSASPIVTPTVEKTNDGFQMVGKKKKRKAKSKSNNGGQFVGPSVKQTIRYEPKATTNTPKKGATNKGNESISSSLLKNWDLTMTTKLSETILDDSLDSVEWRHLGVTKPFTVSIVWESIRPRGDEISYNTNLNVFQCPLCDSQPDSHDHLFFECNFSLQLWNHMKIYADLSQLDWSLRLLLTLSGKRGIIDFSRIRRGLLFVGVGGVWFTSGVPVESCTFFSFSVFFPLVFSWEGFLRRQDQLASSSPDARLLDSYGNLCSIRGNPLYQKKPASSLIKRVYMLSLRERMELDLEARLMGETLVINRSLDPLNGDYIELNDLNEPFELRRNQGDDLMPTIEEGKVIEKFRTRDDKLDTGIDDYPSCCDYDKKIHIDCAHNLKFSCMIRFEFTHINFFPLLYVNVMSKKFHNSIMKDKMVYKGNNVIRSLMNVPIFVGTFSVVMDFAVLEDMDAFRDEGMGNVIFSKPFLREVRIKARRFEGMITIYNGNDSVTYQMVRSHLRFKHYNNEQCNKILPLLKVSDEGKKNGISHPYQKLKGFYKGVLNL